MLATKQIEKSVSAGHSLSGEYTTQHYILFVASCMGSFRSDGAHGIYNLYFVIKSVYVSFLVLIVGLPTFAKQHTKRVHVHLLDTDLGLFIQDLHRLAPDFFLI